MYEFVCKHKVAIEKLNYYEWAKFLERANADTVVDHLLSKKIRFDRRNPISLNTFHIIQLTDEIIESFPCRLAEIAYIHTCYHNLLAAFTGSHTVRNPTAITVKKVIATSPGIMTTG